MSIDTNNYNNIPLNADNYSNYIDSAIANNITHSLKNYHDGDHFFSLYELYEKCELNNVINRVIEDQNHRFAISVIEREFKSNDLGSLKNLLSKSINEDTSNALKDLDEEYVIKSLMKALDIINKEEQSISIDKNILTNIEEYLDILDVIKSVKGINISTLEETNRKVIIQPGIRFAQAKALLNILLNEEHVRRLPEPIINVVKEKLLSDIKGKMLEEIVIYQTSLINKNTFKLFFPTGEFDMVVNDINDKISSVFEIKHSDKIDKNQYNHINDPEKIKAFEKKYFKIKNKIVLYNGEDTTIEDGNIKYLNVSNYMKNICENIINDKVDSYCKNSAFNFDVQSGSNVEDNIWLYLYFYTYVYDKNKSYTKLIAKPEEIGLIKLIEIVTSKKPVVINKKVYKLFIDYLTQLRKDDEYPSNAYDSVINQEIIFVQKCVKNDQYSKSITDGLKYDFLNLLKRIDIDITNNESMARYIEIICDTYFNQ